MSILTWIEDKKRLKILAAPKQHHKVADSSKGLWTRCDKCGVILYIKHLKENQRVCFGCSYHLQMMSGERIETLLDRVPVSSSLPVKKSVKPLQDSYSYKTLNKASLCNTKQRFRKGDTRPGVLRDNTVSTWRPLDETLSPCDPLSFHDQKAYGARLEDAQERTGLQDAIQTGTGMIDGIPVALAVMDFSFMGGSMGSVVGEKITRLIEYATGEGLTLIIVSASGGARMQEGVFSLMQMAKISSALQIYQMCARLLYISILTSPTTGGVTASFAMLGDIIFAEPKALIAFAGRRVIEQTLREDLPDDFQTSEYMLHHGLVDLIVPRRFLRQALSETIRLYQNAPFGVQNPITFLAEEKVRRQWGTLTKRGTKPVDLGDSSNPVYKTMQGVQVQSSVNKALPCKQGSLYALQNKFCTKGVWAPTTYREILTSFEIMLSLFVSGNSKKIEKTGYSSKKGRDPKTVATANRSLKALQKQFLHGSLGGVSSFAQIKSFHKRLCTALQLQSLYKAPLCKNLSCKADKATLCSRKHSLGNRAVASQSSALLARLTPTNPRFVRSFAQLCNANNGFATKKLFVSKKPRQERKDENGSIPISEVETKSRPLQSGALLEGAGSANKHTITNQRFVRSFVSRRKTRFCQPGRQTFLGNSTEDLFSNSDQVSRSGLLHSFRFFSEGAQVSRPYNRLRGSKEKLSVQTLLQLQIKDLLKALCAKRYKTGLGKGVQIYRNGCKKLSKRAETSFNELTNSFFGGLQSSALYAAGPFGQKTKPLGAGGFAAKRNNNGAFDEDSSWGQNHCKSSVAKRFVKSFVTASDKRDSVSRREKEFFLKSSKASKKSVTSAKNDINFLNQAIELAATESVEWRAFYIHQQLSENMGFLEDFLQQDPDSRRKTNNVLFYKSVCRSKKALDE